MTLSPESLRGAVRRKAQRAREKVRSAEEHLDAANAALLKAIPRRDVEAIAKAAKRTASAEIEVHAAAHDLEVVEGLLQDPSPGTPTGGGSGEGVKSLLPHLGRRND